MEVKYVKSSGCFMVFLGIFSLGIAPLAIWWQQRSWPAYIDETGLTTRAGKFIPWNEFTRVVRVATQLGSGATATRVERLELHSPSGKVLVPTERLLDSTQVVAYILDHLPEQAFAA
ncbi:MAG: hypothetical protein D6706_01450 [Chloroflexi bacterium]|nr:MAG: hypothetical protein D6706_01450 [Chloroflexota bacterium]